jgi:alpha-L-arabinofuranosidase/regulation of enolase protein 1 (concanavalin A-like superfamily)
MTSAALRNTLGSALALCAAMAGLQLVATPPSQAVEGKTFSDDFSAATLDSEWQVVNQDAGAWSLSGGKLAVTGQVGDTYQGNNSAKNIFMVDIPVGDFTAEVTLTAPVAKTFQGAGLIAWKDIDNYVRSGLTYVGNLSPSGIAIENDRETNASFTAVSFTDRPGSSGETLRLQRTGNTITTSYLVADQWVIASSTDVTFETTQVGLYALGALDGTTLSATFDDFQITAADGADIQPEGTFTLRRAADGAHLVETAEGLALTEDAPATTLTVSAVPQDDGSVALRTVQDDRPVLVEGGRLVLGQPGAEGSALRLTDAGGGELYLRDGAGTGYAGTSEAGALVVGAKDAAETFKLVAIKTSTGTLAIDGTGTGDQIADEMFGIFFEDINYAADGGLYAELVRNRSFEFAPSEGFTSMTAWQVVNGGGVAPGSNVVNDGARLNEMNRQHFRLISDGPGDGLRNVGYDEGMPFEQGEQYDASFWARTATPQTVTVALEGPDGAVLGQGTVEVPGNDTWAKYDLDLTSAATTSSGRLSLTAGTASVMGIDMVSLMPQDRWSGKNGLSVLRKDLATEIAALNPGFLRFPGGCIVNVNSMYSYDAANGFPRHRAYQWKETIGPVEERPTNANFWGYNQSYGIGYYEYFTFAEDIGAEPLPVVPALLTGCGQNQATNDPALLQRHIQDALDLIEFANGGVDTTWGAKRAAMGHPEPFGLTRIGVGNEENLPHEFAVNFVKFRDAIKAKYPDMIVISNSGPDDAGWAFDTHWDYNRANDADMVDEHYYNDPEWFLLNNNRYDEYDRSGPKVFLGEYASRGNTWWNALTEAAFMTGLQRNGDVVQQASYAPLLANEDHVQWAPDAIWFDNDESWASPNWEVQKLFGNNAGDEVAPSTFTGGVNRPVTGGIFLSTWNTAAAYDDVKVTDNATGEVLFEDGFADSSKWTPNAGSWSVSNGEYVQSATNVTDARSIVNGAYEKDWTNYTLELDARKTAGSEGFLIGFGAEASNDYFWWNLGGWNNSRSVLQKAEGGGAVEVKALENQSLTTGKDYRIKVVVSGNDIELYLDDVLQMEYTSTAGQELFQVVTRDEDSGDLVAKVVNTSGDTVRTQVDVSGTGVAPEGEVTTLTADSLTATNTKGDKNNIKPVTKPLTNLSESFTYEFAPHSVTFIRMHTGDSVAPTVDDASLSGTSVEGWYADPVTVTAVASDDRKLDAVEFRVDGEEWTSKPPEDASIQVSGHGAHVVEVRAVDAAGNVGEIRPISFGIDAEAPVSNATIDEVARTVTVHSADSGVGVEEVQTRLAGSETWVAYADPIQVGDAETTLEFRAVDKLGNTEEAGSVTVPAAEAPDTAASTSTEAKARSRVERGDKLPVRVVVTSSEGTPAGTVQVRKGTKVLAKGRLSAGKVKVTVPTKGLALRKHQLVVRYLGNASYKASQTSVVVKVTK